MHKPIKFVEKGLSIAANGAWMVFNSVNKINQRPSFTPKWSDNGGKGGWEGLKKGKKNQPAAIVHPKMARQAAAQAVRKNKTAARMAARDRLALPHVHARGAAGDSRW